MDAASHAHHPIKSRGGLNFTSFMHWNSTSCNSVWHAPRPCLYMDCLVLDLHREIHSHIPLHLWNQLWRSIESQHSPQTQNLRTQHERIERSETRRLLVFCVLVSTCVHVSKCQVNLKHQILCWGSQIRDLQGCITYGDPYQSLGHLAVFTFCSVESNSATLLKTTPRLGIWNYVASSKANQYLYCWEVSGSKRKTTVGRLYMYIMYVHVSINIYY